MTTRTITVQIGWGLLAVAVLASIAIITAILTHDDDTDTVGVWPQVVRTINGTPTTVQPEDLDR
jgi:hypothetical protein